ncbi:MAG: hypothetical protein IJW63_10530 [Lachnospiraceae bacterium]|nr:hypothetical protein [Lachnospiraceae bacterium]
MAINITPKNDYSYLFSSLGSSSNSGSLGNLSFLSDYASIKNGSYGKLMKAYYSEAASEQVSKIANSKNTSISADASKDLKNMQVATDSLKESADALLVSGEKSVFAKKDVTKTNEDGTTTTSQEYDTEAIYDAVSKLVKDYNAVLEASENISTQSILNKTMNMVTAVYANDSMLSRVGISIGEDGTLSVDKEDFLKSDMDTVKDLFGETGSLGYRISAQSSLINFATTNEVNRSNTYNANGTFTSTNSSGDLFSSLF